MGWAVVGAVVGWFFGRYVGDLIARAGPWSRTPPRTTSRSCSACRFGALGWLVGIGGFTYPFMKMLGREPAPAAARPARWVRYFRMTEDHKVVGMQYLIGVLVFFFTAGLLAMGIRTELLSPTGHVFGPGTYIAIVGEHGTMMMMMASSAVVGPLGNWLVPLMIGSTADGLSPHRGLLVLGLHGRLPGHHDRPAARGLPDGMDGLCAACRPRPGRGWTPTWSASPSSASGMIMAGFNLAATIINYRAPGMTWSRVPIFVWSILSTTALLVLATPTLVVAGYLGVLDRTAQTAFYVTEHGGSSFLWENLFWFFGHPEVYIMALPGFGIVMEMLPVFTRKPLFAYRAAAAGMIGVALLSFFVWQHHLFQSGINPDMRPLFMLTTELISIPTGFSVTS